jgi:hypothetical protein
VQAKKKGPQEGPFSRVKIKAEHKVLRSAKLLEWEETKTVWLYSQPTLSLLAPDNKVSSQGGINNADTYTTARKLSSRNRLTKTLFALCDCYEFCSYFK